MPRIVSVVRKRLPRGTLRIAMPEPGTGPFEVRRMRADEWLALRSLRLEALQDSPLSYGSTYAGDVVRPDRHWQGRAATSNRRSRT
jgi:hypothetical protein